MRHSDRAQRLQHLQRFYSLLHRLEEKAGGPRRLTECTGKMVWPARGILSSWSRVNIELTAVPGHVLCVSERMRFTTAHRRASGPGFPSIEVKLGLVEATTEDRSSA